MPLVGNGRRLGASVRCRAGAAYDWIGFDPCRIGTNKPALSCDPDYGGYGRPDYQPENGAAAAWLSKATAYARACRAASGDLPGQVTTADTVRMWT